jgi:signal transduction histidine kinase
MRRFQPLPALMLDKHRVLLILVNLIGNAIQAIQRIARTEHELILRTEMDGANVRKEGHGFGLHSCVLAAQKMGGTLTASSDGPGRGASFALVLPAQNPVES